MSKWAFCAKRRTYSERTEESREALDRALKPASLRYDDILQPVFILQPFKYILFVISRTNKSPKVITTKTIRTKQSRGIKGQVSNKYFVETLTLKENYKYCILPAHI